MTDRDYILAPNVATVEVSIEPVYAMLDALNMLPALEEYEGLDSWLWELRDSLTPEQLHRNKLVFDGAYAVFTEFDEPWQDFHELASYIEQQDAVALRDKAFFYFYHKCTVKHKENLTIDLPDSAAMLADADLFVESISQMYSEEHDVDQAFLREVHALLNQPDAFQQMIVQHLREIWDQRLAVAWQKMKPTVQASVNAFQNVDFSGLTGLEATRLVTGRDFTYSHFADMLNSAQHLVFVPCTHIGPYVSLMGGKTKLWVKFRARLPQGSQQHLPALDRSEILVRASALADDTRLRILELISQQGELCAQDIIEMLDLSQSASSRHLRHLVATGFLAERRHDGAKCYGLNRDRLTQTLAAVQSFLVGS